MDTGDLTTERDPTSDPEPETARDRGRRSRFGVRWLRQSAPARGLRRLGWLPVSRRTRLTLLIGFGAGVLALTLVNALVAQPFLVPSGSMENTLRVGDRIVVNKVAYRSGHPVQRGDVIVFDGRDSFVQESEQPAPNPVTGLLHRAMGLVGFAGAGQSDYTKRVIGIGGDRVSCCDRKGRIAVNGVRLDERAYLFPGDRGSTVPFDVVVPPRSLFVLGDHRAASSDSRDYLGRPGGGMVPQDRVIGRADWIVWPPSRVGEIKRPSVFARVPDGAHG